MNRSTEILTISGRSSGEVSVNPDSTKAGSLKQQQILLGWNKHKSYSFIGLTICLIAWACIFFPLMVYYDL